MLQGQASGQPAPRGPVQQPPLEKVELVYSLDGVGVLPSGCGQVSSPTGPPANLSMTLPSRWWSSWSRPRGAPFQLGRASLACAQAILPSAITGAAQFITAIRGRND